MATEEPKAPESGRWQFSLRMLLVGVAFVAVGCAALLNASQHWQTFIITATVGILMVAALGGLFCRGRVQAFGAGFAVVGIFYLLFVYVFLEREIFVAKFGTTRALLYIHNHVKEDYPVLPVLRLRTRTQSKPPAPGLRTRTQSKPPYVSFMNIGQYLWALLLAYLGGLLARYFYLTRTDES